MDFSVFNREKIPWKKLLRDARAGDKKAMERFCLKAEPIIRYFCRVHVLKRRLGSDEIRGIAYLALMRFIAGFNGEIIEAALPGLLFRVIRCALIDATRLEQKRAANEVREGSAGGPEEEARYVRFRPAGRETEPEQVLLKAELVKEVQTALTHASSRQRDCIRAVYFDGKKATEYAKETGCSPQFIRKTNRKTLRRMRAILQRRNVV